MIYPHSSGDLLESPQTYRYTPFHGPAFVEAWQLSRQVALRNLPPPALMTLPASTKEAVASPTDSHELLAQLCQVLRDGALVSEPTVAYWLPRLLKKFEVTKRVFKGYEEAPPHRALADSTYKDLSVYLLLGECLLRGWQATRAGYYLSGLLKLNDTLVSQQASLAPDEASYLAWILKAEQDALATLRKELGL